MLEKHRFIFSMLLVAGIGMGCETSIDDATNEADTDSSPEGYANECIAGCNRWYDQCFAQQSRSCRPGYPCKVCQPQRAICYAECAETGQCTNFCIP